jgi:polyisoprenoid-binding protein YceI
MMIYLIINSCKEDSTNANNLVVKDETVSEKSVMNTPKESIPINLEKSTIKWKGSMLFSFGEHYGTVNFKSGYLLKSGDKLSGGSFVVDMNTIVNTDGDYSPNLVEHLKNEDFFDVPKYPEATIEFLQVELNKAGKYKIITDLTIKGIKKSIVLYDVEFIDNSSKLFDETASKMSVKFKIDRTEWNISYASKGISTVKDYAISDAIELEVEVYLK